MHLLWGLLDWTVSKPTVCKHQMTSEPRKLITQNCESVMSKSFPFFSFFNRLPFWHQRNVALSSPPARRFPQQAISIFFSSMFATWWFYFSFYCTIFLEQISYSYFFFIYMFNFGASKLKEAFYHYFNSHKFCYCNDSHKNINIISNIVFFNQN